MPRRSSTEYATQRRILRQLLSPAALQGRGALGRELHLLKRLFALYPDPFFWLQLRPALPLDSLAYFVGYGAADLRQRWAFYQAGEQASKSQRAASWERAISQLEQSLSPNSLDSQTKTPIVSPKRGALDWVDS